MCFSAEASFTASAVLAAAGIYAIKSNKVPSLYYLALIPLLFAIQQFSEGILWLNMPLPDNPPLIAIAAKNIFTGFAYFVWPVYVPLALYIGEGNPERRKFLGIILAIGLAMVAYFIISYLMSDSTIEVKITGHSLDYNYRNPWFAGLYSFIILAACFSSTLPGMKIFGVLVALSILIAAYMYTVVFISVWCFFAAIISLFILFILFRCNRNV